MKIRVKRKVLEDFVRRSLDESWTGAEAMPSDILTQEPMDLEPAVIEPAAGTQVSDTELPVDDEDWRPGNLQELGMAMKQCAENVPEGQIDYLWPRLKLLIKRAQKNVEAEGYAADIDAVQPDKPISDTVY